LFSVFGPCFIRGQNAGPEHAAQASVAKALERLLALRAQRYLSSLAYFANLAKNLPQNWKRAKHSVRQKSCVVWVLVLQKRFKFREVHFDFDADAFPAGV